MVAQQKIVFAALVAASCLAALVAAQGPMSCAQNSQALAQQYSKDLQNASQKLMQTLSGLLGDSTDMTELNNLIGQLMSVGQGLTNTDNSFNPENATNALRQVMEIQGKIMMNLMGNSQAGMKAGMAFGTFSMDLAAAGAKIATQLSAGCLPGTNGGRVYVAPRAH